MSPGSTWSLFRRRALPGGAYASSQSRGSESKGWDPLRSLDESACPYWFPVVRAFFKTIIFTPFLGGL